MGPAREILGETLGSALSCVLASAKCLRMGQCTKEAKGSFVCVLFSVMSKPSLEAPQGTLLHTPSPRSGSQTRSLTCLQGVEWRYHNQNVLIISETGCFQVHVSTKPLSGLLGRTKEGNEHAYTSKKLRGCTDIPTERTVVSHHIKHAQKRPSAGYCTHTRKHG